MKPKLVTFDVYMALLNIQGSLTPIVAEALNMDAGAATDFVRTWRATQMACAAASNALGRGHTPFRDCTRLGLDYALTRHGVDLPDANRDHLVGSWDALHPWPEAVSVVAEIKRRGYVTAILSNGDQAMLDAVAIHFGEAMDHVLSVETAGMYKPHPAVYALPAECLGVAREDTLHVAGGANDVLGAVAFGIPCYWSNRAGDVVIDRQFDADHQGSDLSGVLDIL